MEEKLVLEYSFGTAIFTSESGTMVFLMAKEHTFIKMTVGTMGTGKMAEKKVKVLDFMKFTEHMMANGEKVKKKEKGHSFFQMETCCLTDNGKIIKFKEQVYKLCQMAESTKDNGNNSEKMEKGF